MEIKKYILTPTKTIGEDNEECWLVEVNSPKPLLRNGLQHARHFFIIFKTLEELEKSLSEFSIVEVSEEEYQASLKPTNKLQQLFKNRMV